MDRDKKIEYLLRLMDNKTSLKKLSGENKKAYQYILTGIFINIINGQDHAYYQDDLYYKAHEILNFKSKLPKGYFTAIYMAVTASMQNNFFKNPQDAETPRKTINFFREKLKDVKQGKLLFQAYEIDELIDIKGFMERKGIPHVQKHYWLDFNLESGLIHTTPVFILLGDLKVQWNKYIELENHFKELMEIYKHKISIHNFLNSKEVVEIRHSISSLFRTMIFTAVTFVESYLLEIFLNIKESPFADKEEIKLLNSDDNITDIEIIDKVIFKLFVNVKNKVNNDYKEYKKILNYRNRYVHASSFKEEHTNLSKLQYLLDYDEKMVIKNLITCISLVKNIDDLLPEEIRSLFWWDRLELPDFSKKEKVSLLSLKIPRKSLADYDE